MGNSVKGKLSTLKNIFFCLYGQALIFLSAFLGLDRTGSPGRPGLSSGLGRPGLPSGPEGLVEGGRLDACFLLDGNGGVG